MTERATDTGRESPSPTRRLRNRLDIHEQRFTSGRRDLDWVSTAAAEAAREILDAIDSLVNDGLVGSEALAGLHLSPCDDKGAVCLTDDQRTVTVSGTADKVTLASGSRRVDSPLSARPNVALEEAARFLLPTSAEPFKGPQTQRPSPVQADPYISFWEHIEAHDSEAEKALESLIAAEVEAATRALREQVAAQREATARAWTAFLNVALEDRLEDGTRTLDIVFARNPDLRRRLAAALDEGQAPRPVD